MFHLEILKITNFFFEINKVKYNFGPSINTQKQGNATNLFQAQEKEILEKFTSFLQEAFSSLNE